MTFKKWLANFQDVNLPIGDLARDVNQDDKFPDTRDYDEISDFLYNRVHASRKYTETFEKVYAFYADSFGLKYNSYN